MVDAGEGVVLVVAAVGPAGAGEVVEALVRGQLVAGGAPLFFKKKKNMNGVCSRIIGIGKVLRKRFFKKLESDISHLNKFLFIEQHTLPLFFIMEHKGIFFLTYM